MKRYVLIVALLYGCDVEASLGSHDGGSDAGAPGCRAAPDAGSCGVCQAAMCCEVFAVCDAAPFCPCIADCTLQGHDIDLCTTHCGGVDHGEHAPLLECVRTHCASSCP